MKERERERERERPTLLVRRAYGAYRKMSAENNKVRNNNVRDDNVRDNNVRAHVLPRERGCMYPYKG